MSDKAYKLYLKKDCVDIWFLLDRWKGIPDFELDRILGVCDSNTLPLLQAYEDVTPETHRDLFSDRLYLTPIQRGIFIRRIEVQSGFIRNILTCDGIEIETFDPQFHNQDDCWGMCKTFFLKSDIEKLELENPEYIDPYLVTIDAPLAPTPTVQEIDTLRAKIAELETENAELKAALARQEKDLTTKERHSLLRIVGGLMHGKSLSAPQIRQKIQLGGFGELSENTIRHFIKETEKVRD